VTQFTSNDNAEQFSKAVALNVAVSVSSGNSYSSKGQTLPSRKFAPQNTKLDDKHTAKRILMQKMACLPVRKKSEQG
jgi:hypothetical protein